MLEVKWKCKKCEKVHISSFELETFADITEQEYVCNKFKLQCNKCKKIANFEVFIMSDLRENDFELSLKQIKKARCEMIYAVTKWKKFDENSGECVENVGKLVAGEKGEDNFSSWCEMHLDDKYTQAKDVFKTPFKRALNCVRKMHASGGWHDEILHEVLCFGVLVENAGGAR